MNRRWSVPPSFANGPNLANGQATKEERNVPAKNNAFGSEIANGLHPASDITWPAMRPRPRPQFSIDTSSIATVDVNSMLSPTAGIAWRFDVKHSKQLAPRAKLQYAFRYVRGQMRLQHLLNGWRNPVIPGESLCTRCSNLHLRIDDFVFDRRRVWNQTKPSPDSLGYVRDIIRREKQCRLCRLIVLAFREQSGSQQNDQGDELAIEDQHVQCIMSWQIDGTQLVSDEYGDSTDVPQTRCLRLTWTESRYKDAYLIPAYSNTVFGPQHPFLGRLQTSLDKPIGDKLREWYEICRNGHQRCRDMTKDKQTDQEFESLRSDPYFGVVDLDHMQLTSLPQGERYAALSYVWGDKKLRADKFKATLAHIDALRVEKGLMAFFGQLPLTIQDATRVVRSLGLRYLWVDALCILQDDEDFWNLNACKMHLIYGNAEITICAADGNGANSGTKAVHPLPSKHQWHFDQHTEYIREDLTLMVWNPFETYLERSAWSTRAWTFQEYQLSHRRLIFVEGRAYFQCPSTTMSLDKYSEDTTPGKPQLPLEAYRASVAEYTPRQLTNDEDAVIAFSGICTRLCKDLGGAQVFCLPNTLFDWALLWQPVSAPVRRDASDEPMFPSWSWCAWKSAKIGYLSSFTAGCELDINEWLKNHTWISWFIRDAQGNLNLVWDWNKCYHIYDPPKEARSIGYQREHTVWGDGDWPEESHEDLYGRPLSQRLRDQKRYSFHKTMPKWPFNVKLNTPGRGSASPHRRFLQFWTWSAHFSVKPEDIAQPLGGVYQDPGVGLARFRIFDGDSDFAGMILLPYDFVKTHGPLHEFIALSDARPFTRHEVDIWSHFATAAKEGTEWYLYHVMLVVYEDEKKTVSRRAGVGKMYKRAFDHPVSHPISKGRQWKETILG